MSLTSVEKLLRNKKFGFKLINYGAVFGPTYFIFRTSEFFSLCFHQKCSEREKERKKEKERRKEVFDKNKFSYNQTQLQAIFCTLLNYATLVGNTKH